MSTFAFLWDSYEIEIGFGDIKNTYLYEKGNIEREDFVDGDGGESFIFAFKIDGDKKKRICRKCGEVL